jgi:hypothetical protein
MTTIDNMRTRERVLKAAMFTPRPNGHWGLFLALRGNIGSAKTSHCRELFHRWGFRSEVLVGSIRPPEDYLGIPRFSDDGKFFRYAAPMWVQGCIDNPYTVVVFDEWTAGTSARSFAAQLMIQLDHKVGEVELPDATRIVALYNPVKQAPGGRDLSMANANRAGHIDVTSPTPLEWATYALGQGQKRGKIEDVVKPELDPRKEEERVLKGWLENLSWASGIMAGFVQANPDALETIPDVVDPNASLSFSTCRTMDFARLALASSKAHNLDDPETEIIVGSFIGDGPMGALRAYIANAEIDPVGVLDGKKPFAIDSRHDRTIALVSACSSYVIGDTSKHQERRARKLWGMLGEVGSRAGDLIVPALLTLGRARLHAGRRKPIASMAEATPVLTAVQPILEASGFIRERT